MSKKSSKFTFNIGQVTNLATGDNVIQHNQIGLQGSTAEPPRKNVLEEQPDDVQRFDLKKIRTLLVEGFNGEELRRLCYYEPNFRSVYERLAQETGKDKVIDELIEYVERKELIQTLLILAKELNPAKYEKYQPYMTLPPSSSDKLL